MFHPGHSLGRHFLWKCENQNVMPFRPERCFPRLLMRKTSLLGVLGTDSVSDKSWVSEFQKELSPGGVFKDRPNKHFLDHTAGWEGMAGGALPQKSVGIVKVSESGIWLPTHFSEQATAFKPRFHKITTRSIAWGPWQPVWYSTTPFRDSLCVERNEAKPA